MPMNKETGACIHLDTQTRQCAIYDTRPDICKVHKMYEINSGSIDGVKVPYIVTIDEGTSEILSIYRNYKEDDPKFTRKEYYKLNTLACHTMIDHEGMDAKWKIDIGEYDKDNG